MTATAIQRELQEFSVALVEQCGGLAEFNGERGWAVVPAPLTAAALLPGSEFALCAQPTPGALHVSLAGEFLEITGRLIERAIPRQGSFEIGDRYLTKRDLTDKITETFHWTNARARYGPAEPSTVEYHLWTLLGSMHSEDVWEGLFSVAVNSQTRAAVDMPDLLAEPDIRPAPHQLSAIGCGTFETAIAQGRRHLIAASTAFVERLEQRLKRDRKRLDDYYRGLSREASRSKRGAATPPSAEETAAKKRAVELELRRKLVELAETYSVEAVLKPVSVARACAPALVVEATVQRKLATRVYRLCWNALSRKLEPLACSRCYRATFAPACTNETVDLLCPQCA